MGTRVRDVPPPASSSLRTRAQATAPFPFSESSLPRAPPPPSHLRREQQQHRQDSARPGLHRDASPDELTTAVTLPSLATWAPFTEEFLTSQPIGGDLLTKVPNRSGRPSPRPTHGLRLPVAVSPSCRASQLEAVLSASPNSRRSATRRRRLGPVVLDSRFGPARPWTPRLPPQMPRSSAQAVAAPGPPMGFGLRWPRDGHSRPSPQV